MLMDIQNSRHISHAKLKSRNPLITNMVNRLARRRTLEPLHIRPGDNKHGEQTRASSTRNPVITNKVNRLARRRTSEPLHIRPGDNKHGEQTRASSNVRTSTYKKNEG